jgi:hypothetical protein
LSGTPDHFECFLRVRNPRELYEDALVTRSLEVRLGDAQLVDPSAKDLEGPRHRVVVEALLFGRAGFQHDLSPATKVQPKSRGTSRDEVGGRADNCQDREGPPDQVLVHRRPRGSAAPTKLLTRITSFRPRKWRYRGILPHARWLSPDKGVDQERERLGLSARAVGNSLLSCIGEKRRGKLRP